MPSPQPPARNSNQPILPVHERSPSLAHPGAFQPASDKVPAIVNTDPPETISRSALAIETSAARTPRPESSHGRFATIDAAQTPESLSACVETLLHDLCKAQPLPRTCVTMSLA